MPYTRAYCFILRMHTFSSLARLFFVWRDFFSLARLFFSGATFFCLARLFFAGATFFSLARLFFLWRDFFFLARLFFVGATFFFWRDFFSLARLFFVSLALICRPLLDLLRAQVTNTCSCEQDGGLGRLHKRLIAGMAPTHIDWD